MHRKAIAHLRQIDPRLGDAMRRVGACRFAPVTDGNHYDAIVRSIVYQQLSGGAAATIHGRLLSCFNGRTPLPEELLAADEQMLRGVGLSRQKLSYLRDLASAVIAGRLPVSVLHTMGDDEVIAALTSVKGVGRWTAHMFLIFRLGRPDVLPELDLGVRKAIMQIYRLRKLPLPERVLKIGAPWSPYRTIASWYLWRTLELPAASAKTKSRRGA